MVANMTEEGMEIGESNEQWWTDGAIRMEGKAEKLFRWIDRWKN